MDRNPAKVRGIGLSTAVVVAAGGLSALGQWGDRLGSPQALPDDFVSYAFVDSLKVGAVLFLVLGVTLVVFLVVCRQWATGATGVHPYWVLGPGVGVAVGAAALLFEAQVVRYAPPLVSLPEGRAVIDSLLADLRDDGRGSYRPIPPGDDRLVLDGLPELARLAASVEPVVSRCIDGVGRDTGAVRAGWSFARLVDLSGSGLTGPSPNALWLDLPVDFAERFVGQAGTVLQAAGFEVKPTDFVDVSGTRASPVPAKDAIAFDGNYSFTAAVSPAPDLGALDDGPQTLYRLRFEVSSPCLRAE